MEELRLNSSGNNVLLLQKTLNKIYGNILILDGFFGNNTKNLLERFQSDNNLNKNGILNTETFKMLSKYIEVPTDIPYDSSVFLFNIYAFMYKYTFLNFDIIGNSVMEKNIYSVTFGKGKNNIIYVGGTHANEWITVPILMKYIEDISEEYMLNGKIYDISSKYIFDNTTIHFVPCLNPDGIDLVILGENSAKKYTKDVLKIKDSYPNIRFPLGWKANILGIDLNLQFPAGWDDAKKIKFEQGFTTPAPRDYVGEYPLQAPEAIAIYDYITKNNFNILLTYHTQGEVIYYKYLDFDPKGATELGEKLSDSSGYTLQITPFASSFAGLKDWFIYKYIKPGYTIEAGLGQNPLSLSQFDEIYKDNLGILTLSATFMA